MYLILMRRKTIQLHFQIGSTFRSLCQSSFVYTCWSDFFHVKLMKLVDFNLIILFLSVLYGNDATVSKARYRSWPKEVERGI